MIAPRVRLVVRPSALLWLVAGIGVGVITTIAFPVIAKEQSTCVSTLCVELAEGWQVTGSYQLNDRARVLNIERPRFRFPSGLPSAVQAAAFAPSPSPIPIPTEPVHTPTVTVIPEWRAVAKFSGSSPGQTAVFNISAAQWRVHWTYNQLASGTPTSAPGAPTRTPGLPIYIPPNAPSITASAVPVGDGLMRRVSPLVSAFATGEGATTLTGSGQWFLSVTQAGAPWTFEIDELR